MSDNSTDFPFDERESEEDLKGFGGFITNNIWLPILLGILIVLIVLSVSFKYVRTRRRETSRYHYWALEESGAVTRVELEGRVDNALHRDAALLSCSFYLRSKKEYKLVDHLPEIGSRPKKQWFSLRDRKNKDELLLSITHASDVMALPFTQTTARAFTEICQQLQHPYIQPVNEIAFQEDQRHAIVVQPCCKQGSLKDYMYKSRWSDHYDDKYHYVKRSLELAEIKTFGKQILEAMLYLKERGFPWSGHLHTGNIMMENGLCRLGGYEGTLLGLPSKMKPFLRRSAQNDNKLLDIHCFGHVMYEMLVSEELDAPVPDSTHYRNIRDPQTVEFLSFIFTKHDGEYPSLRKISRHQFFRGSWLAELGLTPPLRTPVPAHLKSVLKIVKKGKPPPRRVLGRSNISRASSYGSLNSQASSRASNYGEADEHSALVQYGLAPISGSDVNQSESSPKEKQPSKAKKLKRMRSELEVAVNMEVPLVPDVHSIDPAEREETRDRPSINGERAQLMNEIRRGTALKKTHTVDKSKPKI